MLKQIDDILNRITMYRLIVYYLAALLLTALILCYLKRLPFDPLDLLFTVAFLIAVCWLTNTIFARTFRVPANVESAYISALILALIIDPSKPSSQLWFLIWVGVLAMASKYILAIKRKHIFNPVALAVAVTALTINQSATWWGGTGWMLPVVAIGGFLIVRKTQREKLVIAFAVAVLVGIVGAGLLSSVDIFNALKQTVIDSPAVFFACIILTEPLTMPPTNRLQIIYGAGVGLLFAPGLHFATFYLTPELAILAGNLFSYLVSPKTRLMLRLKDKVRLAPDTYDFIFTPTQKLAFAPGQYMEWTLGHKHPDNRGNRRYFTLASSPTENTLRLGVKFYPESSSYKKSMLAMDRHSEIVAGQLAGDFTLPDDPKQKLVFIAGGIGITPFRSMIKYLLDTDQKRSIVLFYAARTPGEFVYQDVFQKAEQKIGLKTIYTLTDATSRPPDWLGRVGYINKQLIKREVPDYKACAFYLSGPNAMVTAFEETLLNLGVAREHIKIDFFPGFA